MKDIRALVKALRCTATVIISRDCEGCPYRVLELVTEEEEKLFPTITIEGADYYESCDIDLILLDAADILEEVEE